ncbi:hypothetical protein, conserved, partial [Eimeria tenella]
VGLGLYTALQVAICLDTPENDPQGCVWSSLLLLLQELRASNPLLFLPFSAHAPGLLLPEAADAPQQQQQQPQQQEVLKQLSEVEAPHVCCLLGCLGSHCDVSLPSAAAAGTAAAAAARQNHLVAVGCFVAQAASTLMHLHMQQQLEKHQLTAGAFMGLQHLSEVRNFLFGIGTPPCWLPLQRELAASLCSSKNPAAAAAAAAARAGSLDPGVAAGAAAFAACTSMPCG